MKKQTVKEVTEEDVILKLESLNLAFQEAIKLREEIIAKQREHIAILIVELNRKQWWKFWK